jgi:hypothetical protein
MLVPSFLFAGGPLHPARDGTFFQWAPGVPVNYTIDPGGLSDAVSAFDAQQLIHEATREWTSIESSNFTFQDNGLFAVDINVFNFTSIFGLDLPFNQRPLLPENPVVFDRGGAIIDQYLGLGAGNSVIGFAGARAFDEDARRYLSGWIVLNGNFASDSGFKAAVVHELGHLLGLDHSQGIRELATPFPSPVNRNVPLMYPFQFSPLQPKEPIRDDITWISWIYPSAEFAGTTGTISGAVLRRSGAPLLGANVVAVQVDQEGEEVNSEIVAVVSDFLDVGNGEFLLPGLQPGDYHVFIEPLDPSFTEGNGVGPHELRPTNFPKDYYDADESATEDPTEKLVLSVAAGETISGVTLVANEVVNRLDLLEDDDEMLYEFPDGFTFPFFGEVYSQVVVNSDGNLTFEEGDGKVGAARTELRFLSGPPRIAPAFGDMDPSVGGQIRAVEGEDSLQFIWDEVPEFDADVVRPPNTFSVTLLSNGDIFFDYGETALTPDFSETYPQGLQAIVGISPGGVQSGTPEDLSAGPRTFEMNGAPVYQVFPGETFNLDGLRLYFQSSAEAFYIPFYSGGNLSGNLGDLQQFTGFAVTNYGDRETDLSLEARGNDGMLLFFPSNPGAQGVEAETQIAKLGSQVFGIDFAQRQEGWIRLRSTQSEVASFFMIGNGLKGPQNRLDGSIAVNRQAQRLYFTRAYEGNAVFPSSSGNQDAKTFIGLANPNNESISVTLKHYPPNAPSQGRQVVRSIPGLGVITESLAELFGTSSPFQDGFIEATVDGPGAVGFELIEVGDTLMGLNAVSEVDATESFSAQLAHGEGVIFTSLKLVNTTGFTKTVTLTAYILQPDGAVTTLTEEEELGAWESIQKPVQEVFSLDGSSSLVEGSLRVQCPGGGVIGDVIFGDPNSVKYAAALALQSKPFRKAVFSQISNAGDAFTGLAFLNPNASEVQIDVAVYDRDGELKGEARLVLGALQRISRLLADAEVMVGESAGLIGGYVMVTASQAIVAQELFGNATLDYLAAVPPEVIE